MSEARPFASLTSGLLARKGAAKPAMRPQGFGQMGVSLEDLGWDDMGDGQHVPAPVESIPQHVPSSIAALTPAPGGRSEPAAQEEALSSPPPVVEQQRAIAERLAEPKPAQIARVVPLAPRERPTSARAKAAFTLRLDPERHLKLRLACAVAGRSAQLIVTEALDEFLASRPELDALASQVPAQLGTRN